MRPNSGYNPPLSAEETQMLAGMLSVYRTNPRQVFEYWLVARDAIRITRQCGEPPPWTPDPILRRFKFTNVFRRYDRVTQHYLEWIAPLLETGNPHDVLFHTIAYRIINWPETMEVIGASAQPWPDRRAGVLERLQRMHSTGRKMYTGAYMITAEHEPGKLKYLSTLQTLDAAWELMDDLQDPNRWTVRGLTRECATLPRVGDFIGYEVATDISYLFQLSDKNIWANAGPGAIRGLNRLNQKPLNTRWDEAGSVKAMVALLHGREPLNGVKFTLRDIEHSLCEYDKYCRVLSGDGFPRSSYPGM